MPTSASNHIKQLYTTGKLQSCYTVHNGIVQQPTAAAMHLTAARHNSHTAALQNRNILYIQQEYTTALYSSRTKQPYLLIHKNNSQLPNQTKQTYTATKLRSHIIQPYSPVINSIRIKHLFTGTIHISYSG
jgi:hypothetical protein